MLNRLGADVYVCAQAQDPVVLKVNAQNARPVIAIPTQYALLNLTDAEVRQLRLPIFCV
jgi:hypothetical protein